MATITAVDRARILMDLIKDATVTDATPYASVDKMLGATALEIVNNFWSEYKQQLYEVDGVTPRDPTNEELATFYINKLRQFHKGIRAADRTKSVAEAARVAERAAVDAENSTDLGDDE